MNKYAKLGKNVALMTIGNFASRFLGLLFVPFYTSILSTAEYGVSDMVTTTVTLLFPVFTAMICEAMMRFALDKGSDHEKIFVCGMVVWAVGLGGIILLSPLLNLIPALKGYGLYVALYYIAYSLYFNLSYFARGIEKITIYTLGGIVQTVLTITFNLVFLLWLKAEIRGYLLAYTLADFFAAIFLIFGTKLYKSKPKAFSWKTTKEMLRFSLPMIPNQLSWWVSQSSGKYIINAFCGVAANGIFSIAHKIPTILNAMMSIFSGAWRISAVDGLQSEDTKGFYSTVYNNYCAFLTLCTSFLILFNKFIASLLYAKDFYQAHVFVPTLLLAVMFNGLGDHLGSIYISYKKTKPIFITTFISAVINVALGFALIPAIGNMGASLATLAGYFCIWLIRLIDSQKLIKLDYRYGRDIATFLLLAVQAMVEYLALPVGWVLSGAIFCIVVALRWDAVMLIWNTGLKLLKKWKMPKK